jgi:hypothetical protein
VYLLAVPSYLGRAEVSARLLQAGILGISSQDLQEAFRSLAPEMTETPEELQRAQSLCETEQGQWDASDRRFMRLLEARAVRADATYAAMVAENARWWPSYHWCAVKLFLRDIEGSEGEVSRDREGLLSDETLTAIAPADFADVANRLTDLLTLSQAAQKNSVSPSA